MLASVWVVFALAVSALSTLLSRRGALAAPAMSSDVLARVESLWIKACEQSRKGHLLRAAENYGRAAEVARELGDDNIVTVTMQIQQGQLIHLCALGAPNDTDPSICAARRAECIALFSDAVAALERRRMAGTLLEGKCTATEETWWASQMQQIRNWQAAEATSWAALLLSQPKADLTRT